MSVDRLPNALVSNSGLQQVGNDRSGLDRLKADELAREFESMLMLQMLRQMRQSMTDESEQDMGLSSDTMMDIVDAELARQLSKSGGFGLAEIMKRAIERQIPEAAADAARGAVPLQISPIPAEVRPNRSVEATEAVSRLAGHEAIEASLDSHQLTSAYGWRSDPFTGAARFHHGVDFKAAYGQGVPAAGDGQVVEAAERGAYGLTIVIEHPGGVRTRYAHLANMNVSVGDRVLQGQEIGRVGQSGRATGPHLHFEVIRDGQRVDPTTVVALQGPGLGGLKLAGAFADSPIGGRVHSPAMSGVDDED
ncbi:MAG: peptidoglycan DD-metalloendopeptidase family protein [Vicinamibacterales bacterium]|nr:peptidoglycan DD-metalloendopeptidase family protein [Vicinamibacterales bacterium]